MKKRIIFFQSYYRSFHGAQQSLLRLTRFLDPSRFEPLIIMPGDGPLRFAAEKYNIPVKVIPYPKGLDAFGGKLISSMFHIISACYHLNGKSSSQTNCHGAKDMIEDGVDGYIVPVNDLTALIERVDYPIKEPIVRKRIGLAARKKVVDEFSAEIMARNVENIFWDCIVQKNDGKQGRHGE